MARGGRRGPAAVGRSGPLAPLHGRESRAYVEMARRPGCRASPRPSATPSRRHRPGPGDLLRAAIDAGRAIDRARDRRQRDDRRRRGAAARARRRGRPRRARPRTSPSSIHGWPSSTSRSRATSRTRCSVRPARPPSTVRRRARARADVAESGSPTRAVRRRARGGRGHARSATSPAPGRPAASASGCWRSRTGSGRSPCALASTWSWTRPTSRHGWPAPTWSSPARAGSTPRPRTARPRWASPSARPAAGVPCIAVGGGVEPEGIVALATVGAVTVPVVERPQTVEEAMAAGPAAGRALRRASRAARLDHRAIAVTAAVAIVRMAHRRIDGAPPHRWPEHVFGARWYQLIIAPKTMHATHCPQ